MIQSLRGHSLPEDYTDFDCLKLRGALMFKTCVYCGAEFSNGNVHTKEGWRETQISGFCEDCFDGLFEDDDE